MKDPRNKSEKEMLFVGEDGMPRIDEFSEGN